MKFKLKNFLGFLCFAIPVLAIRVKRNDPDNYDFVIQLTIWGTVIIDIIVFFAWGIFAGWFKLPVGMALGTLCAPTVILTISNLNESFRNEHAGEFLLVAVALIAVSILVGAMCSGGSESHGGGRFGTSNTDGEPPL
ncbi:hypothetical protein CMO96_02595 [Candidatus Woesebacteria bacterium]|nr:hypothetical protein [Candidatus Woesebacteria bacterium]|tara:strand:- start:531 stop:941 length:411 start_codon:yes stop_codon:yes gene_type:complete